MADSGDANGAAAQDGGEQKSEAIRGSEFSWSNVNYSVKVKGKDKMILQDISGSLTSGEVCALIGPSGAGKTSLLNVLAARIRTKGSCNIEGSMLLDGQPIVGANLRKRIAYVMQQDLLCPTQTPREALLFSAKLRLPASIKASEKVELVNKMLGDLGLMKCADVMIGDNMIRGISGGEKKRTSVGIELIMKPKLVFLDEPTSGLDSYAAHSVIAKLRDLATSQGCNVLCTIHQPSSEVFHSFNKVIVLTEGHRFFFGTIDELSQAMARIGKACPNEYNLSDHTMFLLQTTEEEELTGIRKQLNPPGDAPPTTDGGARRVSQRSENETGAGFCTQLVELSRREALGVWRNKPGLIASVLIPVILNLFFGCIFMGVGDTSSPDYDPMSHFGGLTQVAIGGMFGAAQPLLLRFPLDRGIFLREYSTNTYGGAAYFLSKSAVEMPQAFLNAIIVWGVAYGPMGLNGSFLSYVLIFWATGVAAASTALLVGCIAANPEVAQQAAPAIFVPQLLFAGFFIKLEQVPVGLRWIQYLCALKYGMNLNILNEFGEGVRKDWPFPAQAVGETFIEQNDIEPDRWWVYVLILVAVIVVIRLFSLVALMRRASAFF